MEVQQQVVICFVPRTWRRCPVSFCFVFGVFYFAFYFESPRAFPSVGRPTWWHHLFINDSPMCCSSSSFCFRTSTAPASYRRFPSISPIGFYDFLLGTVRNGATSKGPIACAESRKSSSGSLLFFSFFLCNQFSRLQSRVSRSRRGTPRCRCRPFIFTFHSIFARCSARCCRLPEVPHHENDGGRTGKRWFTAPLGFSLIFAGKNSFSPGSHRSCGPIWIELDFHPFHLLSSFISAVDHVRFIRPLKHFLFYIQFKSIPVFFDRKMDSVDSISIDSASFTWSLLLKLT